MLTTDLGACEWFVWDLRRSNLIERGRLDSVVGEFLGTNPEAEPPALADFLVSRELLTRFQADRLLQGKTQGFVLGPYTLMDALGTGSMGTVYKAQSKTDNKWYAVKVLPRRSMWNVRLAKRKVRAFEECRHENVVPFVDVGTAGSMHYLAWGMAEGEPLDKFVAREGKLDPLRVVKLAIQIAEGLTPLHRKRLFHGLVKPSNVLIDSQERVHILDLGIGALLAETEDESLVDTMSTANSVASGLDCASPESVMEPTNLTSLGDQYSLGCTLYFCLSGRYPFQDCSATDKLMAHQFKQPTPLAELAPGTPEALIRIIELLMQKDPAARYAEIDQLLVDLRGIVPGPVAAAPGKRMETTRNPSANTARDSVTPRHEAAVRTTPSGPRAAVRPGSAIDHGTVRDVLERPAVVRGSSTGRAVTGLRQELKNRSAVSAAPVQPSKPMKQPEVREAPLEPAASVEDRFGPVGVISIAVLLCALAWLAAMQWF